MRYFYKIILKIVTTIKCGNLLNGPQLFLSMGDELTIKELYGTLKDSAKKNEVHLVSFTSKNINHYIIKDYDEKTLIKTNNKN